MKKSILNDYLYINIGYVHLNQINAIVIMNEHRRQHSNMRIYLHDNESQFSTQLYNEELLFLKKQGYLSIK